MLQFRQQHDEKSLSHYPFYVMALCRYYIRLKEPVKLLHAVDQSLHLINFIDLQKSFATFWGFRDSMEDVAGMRNGAIICYREARRHLLEVFTQGTEAAGITVPDPIMWIERNRLVAYLDFTDILICPEDRQDNFNVIRANREFKEICHILAGGSFEAFYDLLDDKFERALEEFRTLIPTSRDGFESLVKTISFCDRRQMKKRNVFRIKQKLRSLFFGKNRNPIISAISVPNLDHYLLCRDLMQKALCMFGRYIPIDFTKMIIHHYSEPDYWENDHLFLEKMDFLKLGFAYYQSAMGMREDNSLTRILYHHALSNFSHAGVNFKDDVLCEFLWEN
jgi:hypothetical protein